MKRVLVGTLSCLVVVIGLLVLASRWAPLFWLLVLAIGLYLLFGRNVALELRVGLGGDAAKEGFTEPWFGSGELLPQKARTSASWPGSM